MYRSYSSLVFLLLPILGCGGIHINSTLSQTGSAATISFSPAPGNYTTAQTVSLTASDATAIIYYTISGVTPTLSSPIYSAPISVSSTTTVQAFAVVGGSAGPVASATFAISNSTTPAGTAPPAPVFTPNSGTYPAAQSVSLSDSDPTATIFYTTDGSQPTTSSSVFAAPLKFPTSP